MAIIVEDGTNVTNANSYVTEAELSTYATDRGITLTGTAAVLLIQAMDWVEIQQFPGTPTYTDQALSWPRTDVKFNGVEVATDEIPKNIKTSQLQAAILIDGGADLNPSIGPKVTEETVFGAVSVKYSDSGSSTTFYPQLTNLLSGFSGPNAALGGSNFRVTRA